jgi:O-antigen/teichoic acid export membrane protein
VLAWLSIPICVAIWNEPRVADLIRLASVAFVVTPIGLQFQVLLERELRFRTVAVIETAGALASLAVGVACALGGLGVYSLVWALIAFVSVRALLLAVVGWRAWRPQPRFRWSDCRRFVRFGAFQMGERVLNQFSAQMDRIIVGALTGARALGFYNVSRDLAYRPFLVLNPTITRVAFPVFARVQSDDDRLRAGFLRVIEALSAVMIPLYVAMIVLAEPIIRVGAGPGWEPSIPILRILGFAGLVLSLGNPMGSLVLAKGRAGLAFALNALRIVLDATAIWLVAERGVVAVAWVILAVRLGVMFPLGFLVRWMLVRMKPWEYLRTVGSMLLVSVVMGGAMLALAEGVSWSSDVARLLVCLAAGGLVYVGLMLSWQRRRARRLWGMIRS